MTFLFSRRARGQRPASARRPRTLLEVEWLEDRSLLSGGYLQTNLVGNGPPLAGPAPHTDPLLNGWGFDFAPNGYFWVVNTFTGTSTLYDPQGNSEPPGPVTVPGLPTGIVYNPTPNFLISNGSKSAPATFIFDSLDGTISGWNPAIDPTHAIVMHTTPGAAYTGITLAKNSHGQNVLYAADIANNKVDMFDRGLHSLGSFTDPAVAG